MFSNRYTCVFARSRKLSQQGHDGSRELIDNKRVFAKLQADVANTRFAAAIRGPVGRRRRESPNGRCECPLVRSSSSAQLPADPAVIKAAGGRSKLSLEQYIRARGCRIVEARTKVWVSHHNRQIVPVDRGKHGSAEPCLPFCYQGRFCPERRRCAGNRARLRRALLSVTAVTSHREYYGQSEGYHRRCRRRWLRGRVSASARRLSG
jgi:hypothetical protein